jgi:hypothetical protein
MISSKRLPIFSLAFALVMFSASFAFAAAEQPAQTNNTAAGPNDTSTASLVDITTSQYSQGMHIDFGVETTAAAPENSLDSPSDFSTKYIREHFTLPFYNGEATTWSLTSLADKFSSNPMTDVRNLTDIRNLAVLMQFKF